MEISTKIELFDIEFNYLEKKDIFGNIYYDIIEDLKNKPLELDNSLRITLGNSIKEYINNNIDKFPYDTENLSKLINFDYKSISNRINEIKSINNVEIISLKLKKKKDKLFLYYMCNTYYLSDTNKPILLIPQNYNPMSLTLV